MSEQQKNNTVLSGTTNKKLPIFIKIIQPLLVLMICTAIVVLAGIRPYEKIHTYLQIVFMDDLKQTPTNRSDGLEIVQTEIDTDYNGATSETGTPVYPAFGSQYAVLQSETTDIYAPVYWGTTTELLELGACQTTASTLPGAGGNVVISAHVNTFFHDLQKLKVGDTLTLYTNYGRFTYEVSQCVQFENTDKQYILPTKEEQLTLYTCEMQVFGSSTTRIGVTCKCIGTEFYTDGEAANNE